MSGRSGRINVVQRERLLEFLTEHPDMVNSSFSNRQTATYYDGLWELLADELNDLGGAEGAHKRGARWKKVSKNKSKLYLLKSCNVNVYYL